MDIAPSYSLIGPKLHVGGDRRINHLVQDVNPGSPGWKSGSGTISYGFPMELSGYGSKLGTPKLLNNMDG